MSPVTLCEVQAPRPTLGDLGHIVRFCVTELALPVEVVAREITRGEPLVTLQITAEQAVNQHPVWCLACRLACFCPDARVSVLIRAEAQFAAVSALRRSAGRRQRASAA